MNRLFCFLLFFICLLKVGIAQTPGDTWTSSCIPSGNMQAFYRNDAIRLATFRLRQQGSPLADLTDIPSANIDSVAKIFYAIKNMTSTSLKDTLMNIFSFTNINYMDSLEVDTLHYRVSFPLTSGLSNASVKRINILTTSAVGWITEWANGNINSTSNLQVNQAVNLYGLRPTDMLPFGSGYAIHVKASRGINPFGLAKTFNDILGTTAATAELHAGDGNAVQMEYQPDGIQVTYWGRCGDCNSGCTFGRYWVLKVYHADCQVKYLSSGYFGVAAPLQSPICTRGPVLPVTFGAINGSIVGGYAQLQWHVLTQINTMRFDVEQSFDGSSFEKVASVAATNAQSEKYQWTQNALFNGRRWYRIKAIDLDGKFKYSAIISLTNKKSLAVSVYPNPVKDKQFTIKFNENSKGKFNLTLINMAGQKVWASQIIVPEQTISRTVNIDPNILSGTYVLKIEGGLEASHWVTVVID